MLFVLVGTDRQAVCRSRRTNLRQPEKASDTVLEVDNQIVFGEFAEIDLGAMTFGASKSQKPSGMNCEPSEQFGSR